MASIGFLLFISYLPWFFTEFNLHFELDHQPNTSNVDVKGNTKCSRNFETLFEIKLTDYVYINLFLIFFRFSNW